MDSCQLTMYLGALASCLAKNLSDDDLALLAAVLTQLGDSLATIVVQREWCRNREEACKQSALRSSTTQNLLPIE